MAINRPVSQHIDKERIEYLYNIRCYGVPTIAKECGCNQNTIYRFMKKYGIKIRKHPDAIKLSHLIPEVAVRMGQHKTFFDDEAEKIICKEYMEYGVSAPMLAKRHGCTSAIIRGVLRRRNTPKKSRKEILGDQFKGENNPNFGNGARMEKENNVRWIHDRTKLKACLRESMRLS